MEIIRINDGVRLHILENDIFNSAACSVLIRKELERESVSENIVISEILKRGTNRFRTTREIKRYAQSLWGTQFESYAMKKGNEQIITIYGQTLNRNDSFTKMCELIFEMATEPYCENDGFLEKYFEEERKNAINTLNDKSNDKKDYVKEKCREIMYNEVCADGYKEDFDSLDRVKAFSDYKDILNNAQIEIIVTGDIGESAINKTERMCRDKFGFERNFVLSDNFKEKYNDEYKEKFIDMNVEQSRLCIGYKTDVEPKSDEIYSLAAGNEILGGNGNSKLFANVREKKGLCYYITSKVQRFEGDFIIESGIKESDYEEAVRSIDEETAKIKNGDFSDKELENAVCTLKNKYLLINDSQRSQLDFYANSIILNSENDRDKISNTIGEITREKICESMKNAHKSATVFLSEANVNEK